MKKTLITELKKLNRNLSHLADSVAEHNKNITKNKRRDCYLKIFRIAIIIVVLIF